MADPVIEEFFDYSGHVGENPRPYTYRAYRIQGSGVWFMKGRYMVDFDGAPNCYHPNDLNLLPLASYPTVDIMSWQGALDSAQDAKNNDGTWAAVVLDANGQPVAQGPDDPFPNYYISTVPLVDDNYAATNPRHYADARVLPYFAMPSQILAQQGPWYNQLLDGHTGNFGDYVTAMNLNTGAYGHAIIGDTGNKPEFGEGSFALGQTIGRLDGAAEPEVLYVVFPQTGVGQHTFPNPDNLRQIGQALFDQWGGDACARAVLPQMA